MDVLAQSDCESNIQRIEELLVCGIFEPKNHGNPLHQSAFIELMICLKDLLWIADGVSRRISFSNDIMQKGKVSDVTDAVKVMRDACCHSDTKKRHFDDRGNRGAFNVACGKANLLTIGDVELKSEFDDDIAYFYGSNRLYMRRHIVRAFEEARAALEPLMQSEASGAN